MRQRRDYYYCCERLAACWQGENDHACCYYSATVMSMMLLMGEQRRKKWWEPQKRLMRRNYCHAVKFALDYSWPDWFCLHYSSSFRPSSVCAHTTVLPSVWAHIKTPYYSGSHCVHVKSLIRKKMKNCLNIHSTLISINFLHVNIYASASLNMTIMMSTKYDLYYFH